MEIVETIALQISKLGVSDT